ncbi:MAG: transporter substrate-binding domain-containing protein [Variibacter sp.]|nr:transporter substrate-binding domain-containing protein [Variibacter sp.]
MLGARTRIRGRCGAALLAASLCLGGPAALAEPVLAPTGTLRATYINSNPAQARMDPATGEARGPAADLARELARRLGVPVSVKPAAGVAGVIESVKNGEADIGFVAYDPTRATQVDFSQTYLLAHNSYIVPAGSPYRAVAELDRAGVRIGVGARDAGDLVLTRTLKAATLVRRPSNELPAGIAALKARELDAYAANRTRLLALARNEPGLRVLPDNFYSVEQAIAVRRGNAAGLALVQQFLTEARASGFIRSAIERAGLEGVDVAPPNTR